MLELTKTLLETKDAPEVFETLVNAGLTNLEAARLITEALEQELQDSKVKMEKLVIIWSEGLVDENIEFDSWEAFNATLEKIAKEHDKDGYTGAYAKTKFQVIWQDGITYDGRLDVNSRDDKNVGQHIMDFLKFHTGEHCPAHMTEEEYQHCLSLGVEDAETAKQEVIDYINRYDIVC